MVRLSSSGFSRQRAARHNVRVSKETYSPSEVKDFFVPRESFVTLAIGLDKRGHIHVWQ